MATANRKSDLVVLLNKQILSGILLLACLMSGCTPYQKLRDQWSTAANSQFPPGLPAHPAAAVAATAATNAPQEAQAATATATAEQAASTASGSSEHGEEITPFAVEQSGSGGSISDENSKLPIQAKIEPIPQDLLEEFLPAAQEQSRGIDDRMAPIAQTAKEATKSLIDPSMTSVSESASPTATPGSGAGNSRANSAVASTTQADATTAKQGPPLPPWQRNNSRQAAIQNFSQSVAARAAQPASASASRPNELASRASGVANANAPSSTAMDATLPGGEETFDPFAVTDFALPPSSPTQAANALPTKATAGSAIHRPADESATTTNPLVAKTRPNTNMKTEPAAANNVAQMAAQNALKVAERARTRIAPPLTPKAPSRSVPSPSSTAARAVTKPSSTKPSSSQNASSTPQSSKSTAVIEFSTSMGETLLSQANFSPAPTIAPLQLVAGPALSEPPSNASSKVSPPVNSPSEGPAPTAPPVHGPAAAKTTSAVKATMVSATKVSHNRSQTRPEPSSPTDAIPVASTTTTPASEPSSDVSNTDSSATPSPDTNDATVEAAQEATSDGWQAVPVESAEEWKGSK